MSPASLIAALEGRISLDLMAVSQQGTSRWTVLDGDDAYTFERLVHLAAELNPRNTLVETSRRGGHVWIFHPPVGWLEAQAYGRFLLKEAGIEAEVYPKGPGLGGMRVPGSVHPKTGETYPVIDPATGEVLDLGETFARLRALPLPDVPELYRLEPERPSLSADQPEAFRELVEELSKLTQVRVYAKERAIGRCIFHSPDNHPSMGVAGRRFRCWACGHFGDLWDLRRFMRDGTLPPRG